MSTPQADRDRWLTAVCRGILLPKERNAARQELSDHLDDHRDALLAAGLSPEEAERRALAAMGEPAALCARLRRVHQPVLTRLVQLARGCCIALACILCLSLLLHLARGEALLPGRDGSRRTEQALASGFGRNDDPALRSRRVLDPAARTTIGSCTLTARRLSVDRWEGEDTVRLSLLLCFDNGAFWRDAPVPPSHAVLVADGRRTVIALYPVARQGAAAYAIAVLQTQSPPQMLTLELTTADGAAFPLSIPNEGVILYEKNP